MLDLGVTRCDVVVFFSFLNFQHSYFGYNLLAKKTTHSTYTKVEDDDRNHRQSERMYSYSLCKLN